MSDYPVCKTCGASMIEFDGWAWYTCPECGNKVRIIDGTVTWYDEIFQTGKKNIGQILNLPISAVAEI